MAIGTATHSSFSVKPVLSLSTSWCSHRHQDGYAMVQEMAGLGFNHVELSHGIRITLVPGILRAVSEGVVKVSSTHNFCPLPTGVTRAAPNLYEPSSPDARERDQWIRHTKRSIEFAAQVHARVLVCHAGRVRFGWLAPGRALQRYLRKHREAGRGSSDRKYQALLQKSLTKLRRRLPDFAPHAKSSLLEVLDFARQNGVQLGIENRDAFEELPLDADVREFVDAFGLDAPIGYWHDTGHAEIKEASGLVQHRRQLETMARNILGFHLHDVNAAGRDHQPVGEGHVDFQMVSRFWRPEHILTLELGPGCSAEDVRTSKQRIAALLS